MDNTENYKHWISSQISLATLNMTNGWKRSDGKGSAASFQAESGNSWWLDGRERHRKLREDGSWVTSLKHLKKTRGQTIAGTLQAHEREEGYRK